MADYERALGEDSARRGRKVAFYLQRLPLFQGWQLPRLMTLARRMELKVYQPDETIFEAGEAVDSLCLCLSGSIELVATVENKSVVRYPASAADASLGGSKDKFRMHEVISNRRTQVTVRRIEAGHWFGEECVIPLLVDGTGRVEVASASAAILDAGEGLRHRGLLPRTSKG